MSPNNKVNIRNFEIDKKPMHLASLKRLNSFVVIYFSILLKESDFCICQ